MQRNIRSSEPKPRIVLIGPTSPYRGGVAQYTTELSNSLSIYSELTTISFKRLYPQWLYPGGGDKVKNEVWSKNVWYALDCYWPLSLRKVAKRLSKEKPDLVVITWWTLFWQPGMTYVIYMLKRKNIKVLVICHNVADHNTNNLFRWFSQSMLKQSNLYLAHSSDEVERIRQINPKAHVYKKILPVFSQFPKPKNTEPKRGELEILFFGLIRPYKGLDTILTALERIDTSSIYLTIAGEVWGDKRQFEESVKTRNIDHIELKIRYIDDYEAATYFERADVVALPYLSATGSGVAALAYNYQTPVIATAVGGLKDAVIEGKTGWLIEPGSVQDLARVLKGLTREHAQSKAGHIKKFSKENSWSSMARLIVSIIEED